MEQTASRAWSRAFALAALIALGVARAAGFDAAPEDVPTPYLPSTDVAVDEMLRLADVKPSDLVVDLGSGDGRIPIRAAVQFGARGFGVDIDAGLVRQANENARAAGVADRVRFVQRDAFEADLGEASVVTLYLLSGLVNRLERKLMNELKPGAPIVAHDFGFRDWTPDRSASISKNYYLYVVPAKAGGVWRLEADLDGARREYEVDIEQDHQKIRGGARSAGGAGFLPLFEARLDGDRIRFVPVDEGRAHHFDGRVHATRMEGRVTTGIGKGAVQRAWRAQRDAR